MPTINHVKDEKWHVEYQRKDKKEFNKIIKNLDDQEI